MHPDERSFTVDSSLAKAFPAEGVSVKSRSVAQFAGRSCPIHRLFTLESE